MSEGTKEYWRKYLKLDDHIDESYLKNFHSLNEIFRPLFFFVINLLARFYFRVEVYGMENIPDPPYIIAANHCSSIDQTMVSWAIGKERRKVLYTIATKFFFDNAFARFFMKIAANIVRIDPEADYLSAMQAACKVLRLKKSIYVNPEGTRSEDGTLLPFKTGVGTIAVETGSPIVPTYIDGTLRALPPGTIFPKPHKVKVYFHRPIQAEKYIEKQRTQAAYEIYKEVTNELYARILALKDRAGNVS